MTIRPRRSVLYMPGSNARALEKARELPVDAVILDLEDAVAPDAKAKARELIVRALQNGGFGNREVLVRINGLDTAGGATILPSPPPTPMRCWCRRYRRPSNFARSPSTWSASAPRPAYASGR